MTLELARAVEPTGCAVGIDVDDQALAIARRSAREAGASAKFVRADATEPPGRESFDLAYARLVLSHLADPSAALRAMRSAVRAGGVVAVEDLFTGTLRSEPPAPALDRLQDVYSATVRAHGGDPTIGARLPALFAAAGLTDVREDTVDNRMTAVEDKVFLAELVDNMREAMLATRRGDGYPAGRDPGRRGARGSRYRARLLPGPHSPGLGPPSTLTGRRRSPPRRRGTTMRPWR